MEPAVTDIPPPRVHATETFWMIVCCVILFAAIAGCVRLVWP